MEIERKFLVAQLPELESFPFRELEQSYISRSPVIRLRRQDDEYILTVKGHGLIEREEFELPLTKDEYAALLPKCDGRRIKKRRYLVPVGGCTAELDVFEGDLAPLILVEVEFPTRDAAESFTPPPWFGADVTSDPNYTNANLSK